MKTLRIVPQLRDEEPYLPEVGKASVAAAPTTTTTTTSDRRTRSSNAATSKKLQRQQRQQQQQQNNNNGALDQLVYQSNRDVVAVAGAYLRNRTGRINQVLVDNKIINKSKFSS